MQVKTEQKELSKAQKAFLDFCKELKFGKIEVIIRDGEPKHVVSK